jgi:type III restriction enzyme
MTTFTPKNYQSQVLSSVEAYFEACHEFAKASTAFFETTERLWGRGISYNALDGFAPDMPYFCLRIPTGGGKTWLAAKSVALVNGRFLRTRHSVILWLVPSKTIREQTVNALKDKKHPYHNALTEAGAITVMDLEEAKSISRSTILTSTVVIVATRQAFQVEEEESRKVYQNSGELMQHFEHLSPEQKADLLTDGEGDQQTTPRSLANVLRLHRPFIIVDEAHNSRTELAFDMLARFRPSGILELTATPDMSKTPTNVLHSVSAAELKAEEMIKLPVILEAESNWQQCLANAIERRDVLHQLAEHEQRQGASYLRPIVLIQSEARSQVKQTRDADAVRQELITNQNIPPEQIVVATGEEKGLEALDAQYEKGILDPACPVKYVITQRALAEGWDCPFAYILVSIASVQSSTAVEQLLGRVLRQPNAAHRKDPRLNQSYAFVVSHKFSEAATALRDSLVAAAGFDRKEVTSFVRAGLSEQERIDFGNPQVTHQVVSVPLTEKPDLKKVSTEIKNKVTWESKSKTLTINVPLTVEETEELKATVSTPTAVVAIEQAADVSRKSVKVFRTPAELGLRLAVPQLALKMQGELTLFDDPEVLEYPWNLTTADAKPTADDLSQLKSAYQSGSVGTIDLDDTGKTMKVSFLPKLQRDLGLVYQPENWDEVKLATWLCQNILEESLTHAAKRNFVLAWLQALLRTEEFSLARVNTQKFLVRNLIESRIRALRKQAVQNAYQSTLFGDDFETRVAVPNEEEYAYDFHPNAYAPSRDYNPQSSSYGWFDFRKHYYGRIGDFDSKEEFECACWLDQKAQEGKIEFWVRNLVRRHGASFFLQKGDGRFYPDFICKLPSGVMLIVEYKGGDRYDSAADDRQIGQLWANLSDGRCRFIMVTNKRFDQIEELLK